MAIRTAFFQHQIDCFQNAKSHNYYALLLDPGLGKTLISLALVDYRKTNSSSLFTQTKPFRTIVVCPNTLIENWHEETAKHTDLKSIMLIGSKAKRIKLLNQESDIYIINYESARVLAAELAAKRFDMFIADESHNLKNPKSIQSKACYIIASKAPYRLILTGTPIMNNPLDVFGQYRCLNNAIFGDNFFRFRHRYAEMGGYMGYQVVDWKNMTEFRQKLFSCAIRKTKAECLDLPEKLYQKVMLDLPAEQTTAYKALRQEFITELAGSVVTAPIVLTRLIRFSQVTSGFLKDVEGKEIAFPSNPKLNWLLDFISELAPDSKLVVFCRFIFEINTLSRALSERGVEHVSVFGGVKDRISLVNRFNLEKNVRVFIGQLKAAGVGINLTSANYCVFMSNSYSYGDRYQAEDRCHRIGQDRNVTYIDLLMRSTIDEKILRVLDGKQSLSNMAVDKIAELV